LRQTARATRDGTPRPARRSDDSGPRPAAQGFQMSGPEGNRWMAPTPCHSEGRSIRPADEADSWWDIRRCRASPRATLRGSAVGLTDDPRPTAEMGLTVRYRF
jgi:hypothetical protein